MAWLYVPGLEGSNLESSAPSEMPTGLSVAWNGKPVQPRSWSRVSKTALFRRFLSGTQLPPSTVINGLDSWISSLRASRVSPSPWPANGQAPKTSAISGPTSQGSSESASQDSSSLRTFRGSSQLGLPMDGVPTSTSRPIYEAWVTELRLASSRRRKSARRTSGNGSSSSPWQTPQTDSFRSRGGERKDEEGLDQQARHWPTPDTQNHRDGSVRREEQKGSHALSLHHAVDQWKTPTANEDAAGTVDGKMQQMLTQQAKRASEWLTPTVQDSNKATKKLRADHQDNLTAQVANLEQWGTPSSREWKGAYTEEALTRKDGKSRMGLLGNQAVYSHLGPESESDGGPSSESAPSSRRQLNPLFVEWLMGLPENWTSAEPSACGSLAMESYRSRLQQRFESLQ